MLCKGFEWFEMIWNSAIAIVRDSFEWFKLVWYCSNWIGMDQIGLEWFKYVWNGLKWMRRFRLIWIGSNWIVIVGKWYGIVRNGWGGSVFNCSRWFGIG
jgi:hypothetical protein